MSETFSSAISHIGATLEDWTAPTVRLGVTGLAQSGKTVFITALVDNLLNGGRLSFFEPLAQGQIKSVYLEPQPDDEIPRFDYEAHRAALRGNPPEIMTNWPESTREISQLRVTIEYQPRGRVRSAISRITGLATLHLDIVDYPGEWLLDLPLLEQSYARWSAASLVLSRDPLRARHAGAFHEFLSTLDPTGPQDEDAARTGARLFTHFLQACRAESHVLSTLTPGRFLMPGSYAASPLLTFFPLGVPQAAPPASGSLHAMMARRFEAYKTRVIKPFYRNHFIRLDRQIVLVDTLAALNAGPRAVLDLDRALKGVLASFRTGANSWLSALLGRRIDRILFAATKADHVHEADHDRLRAILAMLTQNARGVADFAGAVTAAEAIASVRATRQGQAEANGEMLPCLIGTPLPGERIGETRFHGNREAAIFPGDLPDDPALVLKALPEDNHAACADAGDVTFVRFRPPVVADPAHPLPHIRLDRALQFLLSDRFG